MMAYGIPVLINAIGVANPILTLAQEDFNFNYINLSKISLKA